MRPFLIPRPSAAVVNGTSLLLSPSSCSTRSQIRPTAPATTLPHSSLRTLRRTPVRSRHVLCSRSAQFHDFQESQTAILSSISHLLSVSHRSPIVCTCLSDCHARRSGGNIQEYLIARPSISPPRSTQPLILIRIWE